jgi:hypothetical protein
MAWESRGGAGRYYTRSRRENGRVVREYCGAGPPGELAARWDEQERKRIEIEHQLWQTGKKAIEQPDEQVDGLEEMARRLICLELQAAGFHQHHRGEWRKKRGQ